jgi:hypothetical protein
VWEVQEKAVGTVLVKGVQRTQVIGRAAKESQRGVALWCAGLVGARLARCLGKVAFVEVEQKSAGQKNDEPLICVDALIDWVKQMCEVMIECLAEENCSERFEVSGAFEWGN